MALEPGNGIPLNIEHLLDFHHRFNISRGIHPVLALTFFRVKEVEFRFPKPQNIRWKFGDLGNLTDLVENFSLPFDLNRHEKQPIGSTTKPLLPKR